MTREDQPRPVHWRQRPEYQERIRAEKLAHAAAERKAEELRQQIEAEYQAQRHERRAALVRHHAAKRRAAQLQRTPAWADTAAILEVYQRARELTMVTGVMHHVDHHIPLQGRLVSGLHVAENLRVVTWIENITKGNRTEETK